VALDELVPRAEGPEQRLTEAMRYAVLAPGKRLRPFFALETGKMFDLAERPVLRAACALECVHAYSLVHDDLPAWTTTTCVAAVRPCTRPMTRPPPSSPATPC
jgi:farnesyl diphosphate synthase